MICFAGRCLAVLATPPQPWSGVRELHPCFRTGDPGYCSYTNSAWSEQRESNSRHQLGRLRHQPLYHARSSKTLAGAAGFEPAKTGFGDQRPSRRVLTPPTPASQNRSPGNPGLWRSQRELNPSLLIDSQVSCRQTQRLNLSNLGCEGRIRTCMNRVRAGDPSQLNDLANVRREQSVTVFSWKEK